MAHWTVRTLANKSIEEHEIWSKDQMTVKRIIGYENGTWSVETGNKLPPDFEFQKNPGHDDNLDSINMWDCAKNNIITVELVEMSDSWYTDAQYPDDMDPEQQIQMENLWNVNYYQGWESQGWKLTSTQAWVWGPLEISDQVGKVVKIINEQ